MDFDKVIGRCNKNDLHSLVDPVVVYYKPTDPERFSLNQTFPTVILDLGSRNIDYLRK